MLLFRLISIKFITSCEITLLICFFGTVFPCRLLFNDKEPHMRLRNLKRACGTTNRFAGPNEFQGLADPVPHEVSKEHMRIMLFYVVCWFWCFRFFNTILKLCFYIMLFVFIAFEVVYFDYVFFVLICFESCLTQTHTHTHTHVKHANQKCMRLLWTYDTNLRFVLLPASLLVSSTWHAQTKRWS